MGKFIMGLEVFLTLAILWLSVLAYIDRHHAVEFMSPAGPVTFISSTACLKYRELVHAKDNCVDATTGEIL